MTIPAALAAMTARPLPLRPLLLMPRPCVFDPPQASLRGPLRIVALATQIGPDVGPLGGLTRLLNGGVVRLFANERGVLSLPLSSIRPLASPAIHLSDGTIVEPPMDGMDVGFGRALPLAVPIDVAVSEVLSATVAVTEGECPDVPLELVVVCGAVAP